MLTSDVIFNEESMKKTPTTESKAINNTDPMSSLRTKLKAADPEIQHYTLALEEENLKLHKRIGKLQAENVSLNNRIAIAEKNTNDRCIHEKLPIECVEKNIDNIDKEIKESEDKLKKLERKR